MSILKFRGHCREGFKKRCTYCFTRQESAHCYYWVLHHQQRLTWSANINFFKHSIFSRTEGDKNGKNVSHFQKKEQVKKNQKTREEVGCEDGKVKMEKSRGKLLVY